MRPQRPSYSDRSASRARSEATRSYPFGTNRSPRLAPSSGGTRSSDSTLRRSGARLATPERSSRSATGRERSSISGETRSSAGRERSSVYRERLQSRLRSGDLSTRPESRSSASSSRSDDGFRTPVRTRRSDLRTGTNPRSGARAEAGRIGDRSTAGSERSSRLGSARSPRHTGTIADSRRLPSRTYSHVGSWGHGHHDHHDHFDHHHHHHHDHHFDHGFRFGFHIGLGYFSYSSFHYRPWFPYYFSHGYYYPWAGYTYYPYTWSYVSYPVYRQTYVYDTVRTVYVEAPGYYTDPYDVTSTYLPPTVVYEEAPAAAAPPTDGALTPREVFARPLVMGIHAGDTPEAARAFARARLDAGKPREAAEALRQAWQMRPDPETLIAIGLCLFADEDWGFASWALTNGIGDSERLVLRTAVLIDEWLGGGRVAAGVESLERYLVENPDDEGASFVLGVMYVLGGRDYAGYVQMSRLEAAAFAPATTRLFVEQARAGMAR